MTARRRLALNIAVGVSAFVVSAVCAMRAYSRGDVRMMAVTLVLDVAVLFVCLLLNVVAMQSERGEADMLRAMAGPVEVSMAGRLQVGHRKSVDGTLLLCRDGVLVDDGCLSFHRRAEVASVDEVRGRGASVLMRDGLRVRMLERGGMDIGTAADLARYASSFM